MSRGRDFRRSYPASQPREAKGGIRARSRRGSFGEKWWARRWVEFLESYGLGSRLSRGKSYARLGQVLDVAVKPGEVTAKVQGSRVRPYRVTIQMKTFSPAQWRKAADLIARRPLLAAKLLAGEMPPEIEGLFEGARLSLFPSSPKDISTDCSCPDWENPCKHIAAVYYILGEEFDRDPFLIFRLRGIERQKLAGMVAGGSAEGGAAGNVEPRAGAEREAETKGRTRARSPGAAKKRPALGPNLAELPVENLPADPEAFWGAPAGQAGEAGWGVEAGEAAGGAGPDPGWDARVPLVAAALPKRLGSFPFWRGKEDFITAMEGIYRRASAAGLRVFLGGETENETDPPTRQRR